MRERSINENVLQPLGWQGRKVGNLHKLPMPRYDESSGWVRHATFHVNFGVGVGGNGWLSVVGGGSVICLPKGVEYINDV